MPASTHSMTGALWPWFCLTVVMLSAGTGCDRPACIGLNPPTQDRNAPMLMHVDVVQEPQPNPWTLLLAVDFVDRDGDVGDGNMLIYMGASSPVILPLAESFATSELKTTATSGRVGVPLTFGQGSVRNDNVVRLGLQLEDAHNHYSNCYSLDLFVHIDLSDPAAYPGPSTQTALRSFVQVPCP